MTLLAKFLNGRICELFTLLRKIICQINFVMIRKSGNCLDDRHSNRVFRLLYLAAAAVLVFNTHFGATDPVSDELLSFLL